MVRQFWQAIIGLMVATVVFTVLSWLYVSSAHVGFAKPSSIAGLISIPTGAPSLWNIVRPSHSTSWIAPLIVLIIQVWFSGGYLGTLVRMNSGQQSNATTFVADGFRAFWRLVVWNVLWDALSLFVFSSGRYLPPFAFTLTLILLVVRYIFLFGDIALVCERQAPFGLALRYGIQTLTSEMVSLLPLAICLMACTGIALALSTHGPTWTFLAVAIAYAVIMTWFNHMIVARYLFFSNWKSRKDSNTAA